MENLPWYAFVIWTVLLIIHSLTKIKVSSILIDYQLSWKEYFILFLIHLPFFVINIIYPFLGYTYIIFFYIFYNKNKQKNDKTIFIWLCITEIIYTFTFSFLFSIIKIFSIYIYSNDILLKCVLFTLEVIVNIYLAKFIRKIYLKYLVDISLSFKNIFIIFLFLLSNLLFFSFISKYKYLNFTEISYLKFVAEGLIAFYNIVFILLFTFLIVVKRKEDIINKEKIQMEEFKKYVVELEKVNISMRKFKHDYNNILTTLNSYIKKGDNTELEKYFSENIIPWSKENFSDNNQNIISLNNLGVKSLQGLIYSKLSTAYGKNINFNIDIFEKIDSINLPEIDLCRSIGILLDNAIEELDKISENQKNINLCIFQSDLAVTIILENTLLNKNLNINTIWQTGYSSKGENRGLGLTIYRETLNKYSHILLETYIENELFIQKITINH